MKNCRVNCISRPGYRSCSVPASGRDIKERGTKKMKSKKHIAVVTAVVMALSMAATTSAFAADGEKYLALGSDLSESEKSTVLDLLDVDDLDEYNVIYVTNSDEHKYLDSYVDSDQIGSRALSSVSIEENDGDSIDVEIHNIGYCTEGMYENALSTAGISGADVVVAGPFEISGTAALVGTIKAYEEMTGETVDDEVIEGCVDEITTTGELGEEIGDKGAAEDIVSAVKEKLADDPEMSDSELEQTIIDAAQDAGYELSEGAVEKVKDMSQNLQGLDIDWDNIKNVFSSVDAQGFFEKIINWFKSLF